MTPSRFIWCQLPAELPANRYILPEFERVLPVLRDYPLTGILRFGYPLASPKPRENAAEISPLPTQQWHVLLAG